MSSYARKLDRAAATATLLCWHGSPYIPGGRWQVEGEMAGIEGQARPQGVNRPLSPHLQIYRPMLTMMMSIAHRITGIALYAGTLLLAWYLLALAMGPDAFETAAWFLNSIVGQLILLGFTWALFHHLLGGVRHFLWDVGYGMDHPTREWLAQGTLVGALVLTVLVWAVGLVIR